MNSPYHPSISPNLKPLLPNEPCVLNWDAENALTERYLLPAVDCIETLFLHLRRGLNPILIDTQPVKNGKPYPLGQCLETSLTMKKLLSQLDASTLIGDAATGYAALAAFLHHGGTMRQVWGDLRGEYFQNAFLAGTLYINVSNDTVTRTKPPIKILPFADAQFKPVEDYRHFAKLTSRYWKAHFFPNHIAPTLAPYFPLVAVIPETGVVFQSDSAYMFAVVKAGEFRASEAVLDALPMSGDLFKLLTRFLVSSSFGIASDPEQGRTLALQLCAKYRAERYQHDAARRATVVKQLQEANKRLACLQVQSGVAKEA